MSITCSMSWIPRREHRPCERALFAPLNDGENGECAFVFNSIFHHICGCHAVWLLYLVTTLIKLAFVTRYTRYTLFPTLKALRGV